MSGSPRVVEGNSRLKPVLSVKDKRVWGQPRLVFTIYFRNGIERSVV